MAPKLLTALVGDRCTGKTTELIKWAAQETADGPMRYIIVAAQPQALEIRNRAQAMLDAEEIERLPRFPVTLGEAQNMRHLLRPVEFGIDDLELMFYYLLRRVDARVAAVTMTCEPTVLTPPVSAAKS